jgi:hypothetical protein
MVPRVRDKHDNEPLRGRYEFGDYGRQRILGVHVGWPVKRHERILVVLEALRLAGARRLDPVPEHLEGVDHDIADHVDLIRADALGEEVLVGVGRWRPEHIDDRIRHHAVDFLGHSSVTAPEPGFKVHDRDPQLGAYHRAGGRGIDVADDYNPVRAVLHADLLVGDHDAAGLLGVGAAADAEVEVGSGNAEVLEDCFRHVAVIVLAGVHEHGIRPVRGLQRVIQRCHLHEVGSGGGDQVDGYWVHFQILATDTIDSRRPAWNCGPLFNAGK